MVWIRWLASRVFLEFVRCVSFITLGRLSSFLFFIHFFFFFQAEDGIRDPLVTGVQTCALPIFLSAGYCSPCTSQLFMESFLAGSASSVSTNGIAQLTAKAGWSSGPVLWRSLRSEERRVGKECRSLWSRDDSKKKYEVCNV